MPIGWKDTNLLKPSKFIFGHLFGREGLAKQAPIVEFNPRVALPELSLTPLARSRPQFAAMDEAAEEYVMLLLADSNLPTGSFVASAGFESYVKHGFFNSNDAASSSSPETNQSIVDFVHSSLENYARSALPFVSDTHSIFSAFVDSSGDESSVRTVLRRLNELDNLYHSMTLNEVTRRASKSQGVALLTLYSKGFSKPLLSQRNETSGNLDSEKNISRLVDRLKLNIRREDMYGHLPICWGVLTAALKLSLGMFSG